MQRKIRVIEERIELVREEIEKLAKKAGEITISVKEAEGKVEKYVWLGKKHGLNF